MPSKTVDSWIDYWNSDVVFRPVMKRTAEYFYRKSKPILCYGRHDSILDFGCGPGYLEEFLAGSGAEIHGVDTSARMISECRTKFAGCPHVFFHVLDHDHYTDLSCLGGKRFSVIVCLSVVQYFDHATRIEELIRSLERVASPGARLLIADIPAGDAPLRDTVDLLRASATEKVVLPTLWFLMRSLVSKYSRIRAAQGLLCVSVHQLKEIVERLSLDAEILREPLTYSRRRTHLLVTCNEGKESPC